MHSLVNDEHFRTCNLPWKKNAGILSIKIPLNRACRNHDLDSCCTLTVMTTEMTARVICCKKIVKLNKYSWI